MGRALPFLLLPDHRPRTLEGAHLRAALLPATAFARAAAPAQLSLF
jgi:hypothetical protein